MPNNFESDTKDCGNAATGDCGGTERRRRAVRRGNRDYGEGARCSSGDPCAKRHPRRARSLLGYARTSAKAGDVEAASETMSGLLRQWQDAGADLEVAQEARKPVEK